MAAVIRIKRHIDEEPLSAFLLNCKKRKTTADEPEYDKSSIIAGVEEARKETTQILKFSGTLTNVSS